MGVSVRMSDNLYWSPSSLQVRNNTYSGTTASATNSSRSLASDFRWVDCGGWQRYIDPNAPERDLKDIWSIPPGKEDNWTYTFATSFSGEPVVVVGMTSTWEYPDAAYTCLSIRSTDASSFTMRRVNGSTPGAQNWNTYFIAGPHWIAVGPDTGA